MKGQGLDCSVEFDAFLSQVLWEDGNGVSVSVLSLLARHNIDPWETASRFRSMSLPSATQALTDLIVPQALLAGLSLDAKRVAEQAVLLLPPYQSLVSLGHSTLPSLRRLLERLWTSPGTRKRNPRA